MIQMQENEHWGRGKDQGAVGRDGDRVSLKAGCKKTQVSVLKLFAIASSSHSACSLALQM